MGEKPNTPDNIRKMITVSSTVTKILNAALSIRRHSTQWKRYLNNPSRHPPKIFESFAEDKLLTFYLFLCDKLRIFHLDPRYPFLVCEQIDERTYIINGGVDDDITTVKAVIEMWRSMGSPGSDCEWGLNFTELEEILKNPTTIKKKRRQIHIGYAFWKINCQFGFHLVLNATGIGYSTEKVDFDVAHFSVEVSFAAAFDKNGVNTFEIIYELFPEFPEIIPSAIQLYFLSVINPKPKHPTCTGDKKMRQEIIPLAEKIVRDIFDTDICYYIDKENVTIHNKSILETMKKHPELFTRWAVDSNMRKLYRKLIDPQTLYD